MTEEHAKLLLKDLSSRLPYGVKLQISSWDDEKMEYVDKADTLYSISSDNHVRTSSEDRDFYIDEVKPYLFPISSMTKEQRNEFPFELSLLNAFINGHISLFEDEELSVDDIIRMMDCLNRNNIDYRGLIPMGLADDATGKNVYQNMGINRGI